MRAAIAEQPVGAAALRRCGQIELFAARRSTGTFGALAE